MTDRDVFLAARDHLLAHREDRDTACRGFAWPRLSTFNWARDYFDWYARDNDRPGLRLVRPDGSAESRTFRELASRSNRVANLLRHAGVNPADRLVIMLPNTVPLWESFLAAMKLGVVTIPATPQLTARDLADRFSRGGARHIITDAAGAAKVGTEARPPGACIVIDDASPGWRSLRESDAMPDALPDPPPTRASDPLLLYFTSGTTAEPKLVEHTFQSYPVGHLSTMYWLGIREGDVHLNISSPGWAKHAWSSVFAPWNAGATVAVYDTARFDARELLATLARERITTLCAPPTVWRMLISEDLGAYPVHLREALSAGEPLNPEVIDRVSRAWGVAIRDGYGQTETTAQIGNTPGQQIRPGSMGRPLPGYTIALLDANGQPAAEGEIAVSLRPEPPLGLMTGYRDQPERMQEAVAAGYYRTGDVARRDVDGYITYVGRADDVFKSADYRISPFELESVLIEHPAVAEAAVVESPDPIRLTVPKAFVALRPGFTGTPEMADEIIAFVRDRVAPYKRIRLLEFAELPKTISGKIRRVELRERERRRVMAERGAAAPG